MCYKKKNKITILESRIVNKNFHSRFSAKKKYYLYKILNRNYKKLDINKDMEKEKSLLKRFKDLFK